MRILVIGSGGREHALVRALKASPSSDFVACAPGSDAIALDVPCVDIFAHTDIVRYCQSEKIDLVVVGPEQPLVDGLADRLHAEKIAVFGPSAAGAQLEASKDFTKKLCDQFGIPTARYATFDALKPALAYVRKHGAPIVIKADGLAAGKGVTVAMELAEAEKALTECFDGVFGNSGQRVVVEEFMEGDEISFFALCDGTTATAFADAQDHKRAYDNDKGPNTGGMGTYSPTPFTRNGMDERIMREIITPTMEGLKKSLISYTGVLFAGIMITAEGPKLIEYNCRFGDPETQAMLARFTGDFALLLMSCAEGKIAPQHLKFSDEAAVCVVMAASGYPGSYVRNTLIQNLERAGELPGVSILHAGTIRAGEQWLARGGRVLNVVATGGSLRQTRYHAYEAVDLIDWPDGFCRRDIGAKALA
ncbi:MAG: phosphoribosylamine--glycine ligase [Rickettsiales bacterium]